MSFSDVVRREFKVSDDERDKGLVTPADVKRYDNICYVKGGDKDASHYLDVYRPLERSEDKLPVIVNVHGGGWVYGDKETYQFYCMDLCRRGYGDFLKNQAPLLEDALSKAAVPYVSKVYGSDDHPLKHVFHCDIRMKEAVICNDEQCRFFEEQGL